MIEHFLLALLVTRPAPAAAPAPRPGVLIQAPQAQLLAREHRAVYSGGVTATRGETTLQCERLTAWFDEARGLKDPSRVECEGRVQARDGERTATGERATFDNARGVLELTGSPEARQGPHQLRGRLVRFHLGTDRLEVEQAETVLQGALRGKGAGVPVRVSAPLLRVSGREGRAVYSGGVTALRGGTELRCRRATAHYTPSKAGVAGEGAVRRVECVGEVVARDGDRWAKGERASFEAASGTLTLTGDPELHQGPVNVTRGRVVRLNVDTDTVEVEQAETVLDPTTVKPPPSARGNGP